MEYGETASYLNMIQLREVGLLRWEMVPLTIGEGSVPRPTPSTRYFVIEPLGIGDDVEARQVCLHGR